MRKLLRARLTALATCIAAAFVLALSTAGAAFAFSESYGGGEICGSNCYIQSGGAHTFYFNEGGSGSGSPYLACQLFNSANANEVSHGYGYCDVYYFGGEYVWARVYNQSGTSHAVGGHAET
jgi:hypothetical protein